MGTSPAAGARDLNQEIRCEVTDSDRQLVRQIVESTGYFSAAEADVAIELVEERLAKGDSSGYHFLFMDIEGSPAGYACFGPIACTVHSFDIYWIAVHKDYQRAGIGRRLMELCEDRIRQMNGRQIYVETSGREQYASTRHFYHRCGYEIAAVFPDFYDQGDDKMVFLKVVEINSAGAEV